MNATLNPGEHDLYLLLVGAGNVGLVNSAYDSRLLRVDAASRSVTLLTPPPDVTPAIDASMGGGIQVSPDGGWFLGLTNLGAPAWTYDAAADRFQNAAFDTKLRAVEAMYCGMPGIFSGGTIGSGLRDDAAAGYYVGKPGSTLQRVGHPLRDVTAVTAEPRGVAWIVTGNSGKNSYCVPFQPFVDPAPSDAVVGNSVQVVSPWRTLTFTSATEHARGATEVDGAGHCAFHTDDGATTSTIYDLRTGESREAGPMTAFAFLH